MSVAAIGALYLGETLEAAMVLLLFLIGERLEAYAASRARTGVQALMALVPETAIRIEHGERVTVPAAQLQPGDVIEVAPGGRLPADGRLLAAASLDNSALTGESLPVELTAGERVSAGCVIVDKVVQIEITSKQGENAIDRILHMIEEAESRKAPRDCGPAISVWCRLADLDLPWPCFAAHRLSLCASDLHTCGDHFGFGGGGASWGFN